tara:strand:- start:5776 stop:7032 length:1257 start_codon:yes stop_codon:yes gene_type:complete
LTKIIFGVHLLFDINVLQPFKVKSFRFQWPADLMTSWAFEMEILLLGWYVIVETQSVLSLTLFASLQWLGTLLAPYLGALGDRLSRRTLLCSLRLIYLVLSLVLMTLALTQSLEPTHVYLVSLLAGLVRPSDLVMRNGLIGDTISGSKLMSAMGLSRTTMDTARIIGALFGAGLFSLFGLGVAYIMVSLFYAISFLLTFGVSNIKTNPVRLNSKKEDSIFLNLKKGLIYVWRTPALLAAMWLAFLVNLTVFPVSHGILPYVAKSIYKVDESGLSHLVASYAFGALLGSITMVLIKLKKNPARFMVINIFLMHLLIIFFAYIETKLSGQILLFFSGYIQSLAMISLVVTLLAIASEKFRGLVMGVRMMAVYGLPLGLMFSGYLIEYLGYGRSVMLYGLIGLILSALVTIRWRKYILVER